MGRLRTDNCLACVSFDWHRPELPNTLGEVFISVTAPAVVTAAGNTRVLNDPVVFSTTGALPTGLAVQTVYYAIPVDLDTFQVAASPNGTAIDVTGGQSGSHTCDVVVMGCHRDAPIADGSSAGKWRPVDADNWCREFTAAAPVLAREVLTAARTYYVRTDGSDGNTGLSNTAAAAFLTIQAAIDHLAMAIDTSTYDVTIQAAAGTYSTATGNSCKSIVGTGKIIIVGDEATPGNVIVTTTGVMTGLTANFYADNCATTYHIRGFKLTSSASGTVYGIQAVNLSFVQFQNVVFDSGFRSHLKGVYGGVLNATGNYSITAGAVQHLETLFFGFIRTASITITLTGTPAFSTAFVNASNLGSIYAELATYSGGATGVRYTGALNATIETAGGGANFFPGDSAGATATGAQYN